MKFLKNILRAYTKTNGHVDAWSVVILISFGFIVIGGYGWSFWWFTPGIAMSGLFFWNH